MLQRAAQRLLAAQPLSLQQSCAAAAAAASSSSSSSYSSLPGDYSLVFDDRSKELSSHVPTPDREIGMCTGAPLETYTRKARVFSPARTAGQQGLANTAGNPKGRSWKIVFDTQEKWINPLMGWTSSADPLENVGRSTLLFHTKEEAVAFCKKHGWEAQVVEPEVRRTTRQKRFNGYGENFSIKRAGLPDLSTLPSERGVGAAAAAKPSKASKQS